jgi:hypothetical protein
MKEGFIIISNLKNDRKFVIGESLKEIQKFII